MVVNLEGEIKRLIEDNNMLLEQKNKLSKAIESIYSLSAHAKTIWITN